MKFSTIVGTFALSTLEAFRAYASPDDSVSPAEKPAKADKLNLSPGVENLSK
ncbi:hypothetical protein E4U59_003615 [Claviceps monticola]|nr:hypothetical protein E4U59_003615 [Claviceps monticola]